MSPQSVKDHCEVPSRRVEDGRVIETHAETWRRGSALAVPCVQSDVVMISAGGNKCRLLTIHGDKFESKQVAIKAKRTIKVRDFKMDVPDARLRGNPVFV